MGSARPAILEVIRVCCIFEREKMKTKRERGNSILVKVFFGIFESLLAACQSDHYGSSCKAQRVSLFQ